MLKSLPIADWGHFLVLLHLFLYLYLPVVSSYIGSSLVSENQVSVLSLYHN